MHTKADIEMWLMDKCTMDTAQSCLSGTGLAALHKMVFGHESSIKKVDAVQDLAAFYADGANLRDLWNGKAVGHIPATVFNKAEKAFITMIFQFNGREYKPAAKELAASLNLSYKEEKWPYSFFDPDPSELDYAFDQVHLASLYVLKQHYPQTKAMLFFPGGREMPFFVREALAPLIPAFEYSYGCYTPKNNDFFIGRADRISDFSAVVRFVGSETIKVKPNTFDPTRAKLAKMVEQVGFNEVCDWHGLACSPRDAKRINDFKVALPLFVLSANAGLFDIDEAGFVKPSEASIDWLANPPYLFVKKLFDSYMTTNQIYEIHYINHISVRDAESWIDWAACRETVVALLKTCPISQWIPFADFERYMFVFNEDFFRKHLRGAVYLKGFDAGLRYEGEEPDWDECDVQLIRLIFSFLSAMGLLDIAYHENTPRFKGVKDDFCVGIAGFRITPLGAWIFGMADTYETNHTDVLQAEEDGLSVQADYTIVISGLKSRVAHESYLSRFLTKVSVDDHVSVYKADFQSMIRAYNNGIEPKAIKSYLKKASTNPLPENIIHTFDDWQSKVGKVRIRTVTVLEADDAFLLEELIHADGMESLVDEKITHGVVITGDRNPTRVKSIVEKKGWLVAAQLKSRGCKKNT